MSGRTLIKNHCLNRVNKFVLVCYLKSEMSLESATNNNNRLNFVF